MSLAHELERLTELHRSGALSDTEFASAKARALGATSYASADTVGERLRALRRSKTDRWLGGICGGLAPMSGLPAWLWRLMFALLVACGGTGLMVYLLLWVLVPLEDGIADAGTGSLRAG